MAKKQKKKKSIFKKFIRFIFILIIVVAIIGYLGLRSYNEVIPIKEDIENFSFETPDSIDDEFVLPTKIGEKITIEWTSSHEHIISKTGEINQPSFEEGGVNVTVTGKVNVELKEFFSKVIFNYVAKNYNDTYEFTIFVPAKVATDEEKVNSVISKLELTDETYYSIALPLKGCYEGVNISWESNNLTVLTNEGEVITPSVDSLVKLKAIVSCGSYSNEKEFEIKVLSNEPTSLIVDDHFDNQAPTSTYKTIVSVNGVSYENARIIEVEGGISEDEPDVNATVPTILRLRNKDENNGSFEIANITNPKDFAFKYKFSGTQKTESSKLIITFESEGVSTIEEIVVIHTEDFISYTKDISSYNEVSIKVTHIDEWSSDTYIDIDDVNVTRNINISDLENWIINNTQTVFSTSVMLPTTTIYGGIVSWESNSSAFTNYGLVIKQNEQTNVTLTCNIKYLTENITFTIDVVVKGYQTSEALEIYFIDIGKYGAGDCGECTYIKYKDIDIIVDAGDNFDSTKQAINEAINQRLQDDVIEYVIATHPDGDHIGGMESLFENYQIENLIKFEGEYHTQKFEKMKVAYNNEGCNIYEIKSDIIDKGLQENFISLDANINISFIDTTYYNTEESNGKSIVFTLKAYNTTVLMTGDADNASGHTDLEQKYMNSVGNIDILKVVHHGTRNGTTIDYLNVVDPEVAIICNGNYLGNKHGHPTPKALSNLYQYDQLMKVYAICGGGTIDGVVNESNGTYKCSSEDRFQDRNGLITVIIDNNGYELSSEYYGDNILEIKDTTYFKAIEENGLL